MRTAVFVRSALIAFASIAVPFAARAIDTYGPGAGEVQIPALGIGSYTLLNVVLTIDPSSISGPSGFMPAGTQDSYNPATNVVTVPAIKVGGSMYYNAAASVTQLTSIGAVAGADTFDGTELVLRNVEIIGGQTYHNVTLSVGLADVKAVNNGLPGVIVDQFDPVSGQLTIGAVLADSKVYTNVVLNVTLSNVVAVAGYTETVLHVFTDNGSPPDGLGPSSNLVMDSSGNLFGTTGGGGRHGFGAVFKIAPSGGETLLYSFAGGTDGSGPEGLIMDSAGNLYGTTIGGDVGGDNGTVFRLTPDGVETVLYRFPGGVAGVSPSPGVIMDSAGNLYGSTTDGGKSGHGMVFKLTPAGTETVLYSFGGGYDGAYPSSVIMDGSGNLYGTTAGGDLSNDYGTVFKISPAGTETVLYRFDGINEEFPHGGLVMDSAGNLYGAMYSAVFKVTPSGSETHLYSSFAGAGPSAGLILDSAGNLYGTTGEGSEYGTVFMLTPSGVETILHTFTGTTDGAAPAARLFLDEAGTIYGTTSFGGEYCTGPDEFCGWYGTAFKIQ